MAAVLLALTAAPGSAIDIELNDFGPDRVERQRAYNRGATPLPGTPDLASLDQRLAAKGLVKGSPIFIRIFKETSELELWMQRESDKTFVLLDTYPICHWTGTLGPKLREGDRQSPEGFYTVRWQQTRLVGRWQKAFNLGFPNPFDRINGRSGSHILVHGGCSSVGCYAMTESVQDEIFGLAGAAIDKGQHRFHVHVFPFRMTDANMERHRHHLWMDFWRDLKAGYDAFERTHLPPRVGICEQRYQVVEGDPEDAGNPTANVMLRPQSAQSPLPTGYAPPRCEMEGERTRMARVTPASAARQDPPAVAPRPASEPVAKAKPRQRTAAAEEPDPPVPQKPRRRPRTTSNGGEPPLKDEHDNGHGSRLAVGAPRLQGNGD